MILRTFTMLGGESKSTPSDPYPNLTLNSFAKFVGEAGWPCVLANIGMSQSGSLPGAVGWDKMWDGHVKLPWKVMNFPWELEDP